MRKLMMTLGTLALMATPASAQMGPIDDILDDIFDNPRRAPHAQSLIETIPVNIDMQSLRSMQNHSIIINVYKPVQPGMTRPQLIGQSRMILTGMPDSLGLVVAVPETVTRDLDFVVVNAAVLDEQDQEVLISRQDEFYKGRGTVHLDLITPGNAAATPPQNGAKVEQIEGKADLPRNAPDLMRGASMTVELVELDASGLAGGPGEVIMGQTFVDLDKEKAPFKFKLDYVAPPANGRVRVIRAYITDWAGRRLYETLRGEPFRGEDDNYRIDLEPAPLP